MFRLHLIGRGASTSSGIPGLAGPKANIVIHTFMLTLVIYHMHTVLFLINHLLLNPLNWIHIRSAFFVDSIT